jgi:hypothetical protein
LRESAVSFLTAATHRMGDLWLYALMGSTSFGSAVATEGRAVSTAPTVEVEARHLSNGRDDAKREPDNVVRLPVGCQKSIITLRRARTRG